MRTGKLWKNQSEGFSLVEVIVVISIGALLILSLFSLFRTNLLVRTANQNMTAAVFLAENIMERIRRLPFDMHQSQPSIKGLQAELLENGNTIQTFFSYLDLDVPDNAHLLTNTQSLSSISLEEEGQSSVLKAVVAIRWAETLRRTGNETGNQPQEYRLVTLIARGGLNDFITTQ